VRRILFFRLVALVLAALLALTFRAVWGLW
jgi:hypothetical protein